MQKLSGCKCFSVQTHLCLKLLCAKASLCKSFLRAPGFGCKRLLSDSQSFLPCRRAEMSFEEMRKVEQCPDELKIVEKNLEDI